MQRTIPASPRWLWLNGVALAFSLSHLFIDWHIGLFGPSSEIMLGVQALLILTIAAAYAWWGIAFALAGRGERFGFVSLLTLSVFWAFIANGLLVLLACPPPCAGGFPYQDITHFGSFVFGGWAAYETRKVIEERQYTLGWQIPIAGFVVMAGLLALQGITALR